MGETLDEFRRDLTGQAKNILGDKHLAVAGRRRADADGRDGKGGADGARDGLHGAFDHQRKGAGIGHGAGVAHHLGRLLLGTALGAEAAQRVDRLRLEADMAHHRHAAIDQIADGVGHLGAALQLDPGGAGLGHDAGTGAEGLGRALLIGAERQVDDDAGTRRTAHHRLAVIDHHVERDAERRLHAIDHHAERIAHQQHIDMGIEQTGHRRRIGGQHDDRRLALHKPNVAAGASPRLDFSAHERVPM